MSLFGAMQSGVSGLTSQASAMGGISDNIANVSTVGYKRTQVNFQTLVTAQTSRTIYSPGGVQSKPRQDTSVQGLLKGTTSSTDIAISGGGFFVVNKARTPGINDEYVFTRAGSFFMDKEGYLQNTSGYYLQAWPTDARGNVVPANRDLATPNQGVITTDYMETINLRTIGSSAAATTRIFASANLPSGDSFATGTDKVTHRLPVEVHDSLGGTHNLNFGFSAARGDNNWDVKLNPPQGVEVLSLLDNTDAVYSSIGQLEFSEDPVDGASLVIDGVTYEFDDGTGAAVAGGRVAVDISTVNITRAQMVAALVNAVNTRDSDFDTVNDRIQVSPNSPTTILFTEDGTGEFTVDPAGLLGPNGGRLVRQKTAFTVQPRDNMYTEYKQFIFAGVPADGDALTVNGTVYTFAAAEAANGNNNDTTIRIDTVANMLADLEASIEANDPDFQAGADTVRTRAHNGNAAAAANTLVLGMPADGADYIVNFSAGFANLPNNPSVTNAAGNPQPWAVGDNTISTAPAITFDSQGRPTAFNVTKVEMLGLDNGAANMDDDTAGGQSERIELDFGRLNQANGLTQLDGDYNKGTVQENGKEFGIFNGLIVDENGLVTVKFTNGDKRAVYKIPLSTFTNTNQLGMLSGNVWNQTEDSGDYTLRNAGLGIAGKIQQASLEQANVDIGSEFTDMIVVQRAYSAAARIISTSDEMLEELMRTKR